MLCLLKTCKSTAPSGLSQAKVATTNTLFISTVPIRTAEAPNPYARNSEMATEPTLMPKNGQVQHPMPSVHDTATDTTTPPAPPLYNSSQSSSLDTPRAQIDQRALYGKPTKEPPGALLELEGWMWDSEPQPQDGTEEAGKLVFAIKVDAFGEVIAVQTLERTVSASVEKLYRDALTDLTFSRTKESLVAAPPQTSQGKVTFILRVR